MVTRVAFAFIALKIASLVLLDVRAFLVAFRAELLGAVISLESRVLQHVGGLVEVVLGVLLGDTLQKITLQLLEAAIEAAVAIDFVLVHIERRLQAIKRIHLLPPLVIQLKLISIQVLLINLLLLLPHFIFEPLYNLTITAFLLALNVLQVLQLIQCFFISSFQLLIFIL